MAETWTLNGTVFIACNCAYGCPCNFNALPTHGFCEGGWTWHVGEGSFGGTSLDDLNFTVMVKWPGAIHEGGGEAVVLIDERADDGQRAAIETLIGGDAGGPWGVLAWTWPKINGPYAVPYDITENGIEYRIHAGDKLEVVSGPVKNPVTGAEVRPGAVLPEGIILKRADLGASQTFRVSDGIALEYSDRYTAVGPFDYSG